MSQALAGYSGATLPTLFAPDDAAARRFILFFAGKIRNRHTRRAYGHAATEFAFWCERSELKRLRDIEPVHVAAYIEGLKDRLASPSIEQHLAAIRMLFDWLVVGQVVATNPASPVRGPKYSVRRGKTPTLTAEETRVLLDSIPPSSAVDLRDRALIALMVHTFVRVGAATQMRRGRLRARAKDLGAPSREGRQAPRNALPSQSRGVLARLYRHGRPRERREGILFRTARRHTGKISREPMSQSDAWRMIRRRALAAGIKTKIGNHSFSATGITE